MDIVDIINFYNLNVIKPQSKLLPILLGHVHGHYAYGTSSVRDEGLIFVSIVAQNPSAHVGGGLILFDSGNSEASNYLSV